VNVNGQTVPARLFGDREEAFRYARDPQYIPRDVSLEFLARWPWTDAYTYDLAVVQLTDGRPEEVTGIQYQREAGPTNVAKPRKPSGWDGLPDWVSDQLIDAHRGVFRHGGRLVAFGNDGYAVEGDDGSPEEGDGCREAKLFRAWLTAHGYAVEEFGTSGDGSTWCMLLRAPEGARIELVEQALWDCWWKVKTDPAGALAASFSRGQRQIAKKVLSAIDD
jgi:hypothetical protein